MKKGLIMEGGAMRGMFTAGVTDVFMEKGITFDGAIGTSAGAAFGCNYKSGQIGRALRYNKEYCADKRYVSTREFFRTGNMYSEDFCYHEIPMSLDKFDFDAFNSNPMEFYITCTNIETGRAVHHKHDEKNDDENTFLEWVRASCAMPMLEQIVEIGGVKLLDGGVGDSVPVRYFEEMGYDRNVVILTQPLSYKKRRIKYGMMAKVKYRHYPKLTKAMLDRHERYNETYEYIRDKELKGELIVVRPPEPLNISISHDKHEIQRVYDIGRREGLKAIKRVKEFLEEE
ncbi:MAG: patatin family protein [Lachnospiraceae bacterium]|nr:patatin family protein [Lachnospiraceae bacterium]